MEFIIYTVGDLWLSRTVWVVVVDARGLIAVVISRWLNLIGLVVTQVWLTSIHLVAGGHLYILDTQGLVGFICVSGMNAVVPAVGISYLRRGMFDGDSLAGCLWVMWNVVDLI